MKEIIKYADIPIIKVQFHCPKCGCIFKAYPADYTVNRAYTWPDNKPQSTTYASFCPLCGKSIIEDEKDVEVETFIGYIDY